LDPPEITLQTRIETEYAESNPPKTGIVWPKVVTRAFTRDVHSVGKDMIWVTGQDETARPITFKHKRGDLLLIVHVYSRAKSGSEDDVKAALSKETNMIEEVSRIVTADPNMGELLIGLKHYVDQDDETANPPIYSHDIHVQCTHLR